MTNDFMDIGNGFVPIFEGRYFLERATGKIYKIDSETNELKEIDAPDDLEGFNDDNKTT